ncbi:MAG: glycosyltransferase family 2 protein [Pseudomonadota bacterium]
MSDFSTQGDTPAFSVVVPVYNTVDSLEEIARKTKAVFTGLGIKYELIFVDDGSANVKTWPTLVDLSNNDDCVTAIQLSRNFGQQSATMCGIRQSKGDFVITMDDDLQHNPDDIPKLIGQSDHDIVIAQFIKKRHGFFKRVTSRIKGIFDTIIIGKPRHIQLSPFRMINRSTIDGMLSINTANPLIPALMMFVSKDIVGVPINHHDRSEGKSNYTLRRMFRMFNHLIIGNSSLLLKVIGYVGMLMAFLSLIFGLIIVINQLFASSFAVGWSSVMVTVLFVGGMLLFSMGIIGEYLIRIISGTESRPSYVIRHIV